MNELASTPPKWLRRILLFALAALVVAGGGLALTRALARDPRLEYPVPPFAQIGVIEGFYGTPWSHAARLDVLRFMARVGMNAYYYAPKDDPYHRQRWRQPYPEAERERLWELARTAHELQIDFYYALSPGLSISYGDSADWVALRRKIASVHDLGVRHFALFLDDLPAGLTRPEDRRRFPTLADAHAYLINRLYRYLAGREAVLVVTPTTYTDAWGDREYLRRLGAAVPPEVPFLWTGPDVASREITARDADAWSEVTGRPPLLWDNYPVNDYARWRLFLGPLRGRAPDLAIEATGILSNPMSQPHASMLALATVADYARDPSAYDPGRSLRRATRELFGVDAAPHVRPFLEIYGDYWWDENLFEPLFVPGRPVDVGAVRRGLTALDAALRALAGASLTSNAAAQAFRAEAAPIVAATHRALERLQGDSAYELRGGSLTFRAELDRISAPRAARAVSVDGDLAEWDGRAWRPLHGNTGGAEATVAWRGDTVYLALRVPDERARAEAGARVGEGDHVAVVLDLDPEDGSLHIGPADPVILLPPPAGSRAAPPRVLSLRFAGFMGKNVAARRDLRFSELLVTSLAQEPSDTVALVLERIRYAARRTEAGYEVEVALPRFERTSLRLSVVVADLDAGRWRFHALPLRNYPGNTATFATVELVERE